MVSLPELVERQSMLIANLQAVQEDMSKTCGTSIIPYPIPVERMLQKKLLELDVKIRDSQFKAFHIGGDTCIK